MRKLLVMTNQRQLAMTNETTRSTVMTNQRQLVITNETTSSNDQSETAGYEQ